MAVPKTTETRCRDGSVQARQVIKTTQATPSLHLQKSYLFKLPQGLSRESKMYPFDCNLNLIIPLILVLLHVYVSRMEK